MLDSLGPTKPAPEPTEFTPLSEQEWRECMMESLRPFLPIFRLFEQSRIPWAVTGAFTGVIEGLRISTQDIDILVPRERIQEVNDLLQEHGFLASKEDGLSPFSPDPEGSQGSRHRKFSSAAWGKLQVPDSSGKTQIIGDIVADYAVLVGEGKKRVVVAGITNSGELISSGLTGQLGLSESRRIPKKSVPVQIEGKESTLELPYIPFKQHLLKYLLSDKPGYQRYANAITQMT